MRHAGRAGLDDEPDMDDQDAARARGLREPRRVGDRVLLAACAGEPEEAKAPPSMTTSFCMSWMISAQRDGSSA